LAEGAADIDSRMSEAEPSLDAAEVVSPRVDFYVLSEATSEASLRLACRLAEKAYRMGHRVHIHTDSADQARRLDQILWTFRAGSFLPHALVSEGAPSDYPIRIGWDPTDPQQGDVLINLSTAVAPFYATFQRVAELVGPSEAERLAGRDRYRFYRDRGHTPHSHQLSAAG
jgi:DNA polymerase-3 subunit chi